MSLNYRISFLLVLLFARSTFAQDDNRTLEIGQFIQLVLMHHPLSKQAGLWVDKARYDLLATRGSFDPKLKSNFSEKEFSGDTYWNTLDATLNVPLWIGELKGGYERSGGKYLNPEQLTGNGGLLYAGYTLPLGNGLFIDERRNALQQAKLYVRASEADQQAMLSKLVAKATSDYWNWFFAAEQMKLSDEVLTLAEFRFNAIRELYRGGNQSALDTVEAFGNLLQRRNLMNQAQIDLQNALAQVSVHLWDEEGRPVVLRAEKQPKWINPGSALNFDRADSLIQAIRENHPLLTKQKTEIEQLDIERRFRIEQLKPDLSLTYNFLRNANGVTPVEDGQLFMNNYKVGVSAGMPLLLRKERGKLRSTQTLQSIRKLEFERTERSLNLNLRARLNEIALLREQVLRQVAINDAAKTLVEGEQNRFLNGESSVFMVNTRETNLIATGLKLAELQQKFAKSIALFYEEAGIYSWNY
jgi:outer membrane protein TolC